MLTDLYAYLTSASTTGLTTAQQTAITDIRSKIATRLYPDVLAEGCDLPACRYALVSDPVEHTIDGQPDGLYMARVQIDVVSIDFLTREALVADFKAALDGFTGALVSTSVDVITCDNRVNTYESDRKQYWSAIDFLVLYHA